MRYDDYQSLVKLYKRTVSRNRFSFLERRYKRLKKRGHPRTYIKIRKHKYYKPVIFDVNPFLDFTRKKEKWKNYFLVWYELAVYMRTQLLMWSSIKSWKYFHLKKRVCKTFGLNRKWYRLMHFFYEYRFIKSFYSISFNTYSKYLSRSRHKKLRRFIRKYIKSLRWESRRLLRKLRRFKYKSKFKRNRFLRKSIYVNSKKPRRLRRSIKSILGRRWWSSFNHFKSIIRRYFRYKGLKSSNSIKEKRKYSFYKKIFKYFFIKKYNSLDDSTRTNRRMYVRFIKLLNSRTFKRYFKMKYANFVRAKRFIKSHRLLDDTWYRTKRKFKSYRLHATTKTDSISKIYSLGLSSTINMSRVTPSLRYGLMSLVYLSNNGRYRECGYISNAVKSLTYTDTKLTNNALSLVRRICTVFKQGLSTLPRRRLSTKKYNIMKNRRFALAKVSRYMKRRPLLLPILSRFVYSSKKKLALDLLKYKYLKPTLNDYERDSYKLSIMRKIRKWKFYRRRLKKMRRAFNRVRRLAGTLKSWFILRLTSKYRKVLLRLRKYMRVFSPASRTYPIMVKWNPVYNNYLFFMLLIYIIRKHYFLDAYIKPYILQVMFMFAYLNKESLSKKIIKWRSINKWNTGNYSLLTHYLVYLNA